MQKVTVVDKLRGIASLIVFLFHLICLSSGYIPEGWLTDIFYYGKFGVHFFFVISGFVITYSMIQAGYGLKDFFTFLKKRLIRIEPPYLVMVVLIAGFLLFRAWSGLGAANKDLMPSWPQFFLHAGYLIPFSSYSWLSIVFWTLAIEFQFYLIFSLFLPLLKKSVYGRVVFLLALFAGSFWMGRDDNFLYWSPVFIAGIYLALLRFKIVNGLETAITLVAAFAFIMYKMGGEILVFTMIPSVIIYFNRDFKSRILDFFGKISYSLYLCHTLIAFTIINLAIRYTSAAWQKPFFVAVAFGATILFSYGLYYVVERPFKRIASAIKYKK